MLALELAFALWTFVAQDRPPATARDNFSAAKALYASGAYEEALTRLTTAVADGGAAEVNQYRALCLLALGRTDDAERSLEELVTQQPLFKMSDTDVSPRVVTMFHSVRRRLLPTAVRDLYARARANFDQKAFAPAAAQLRDLLQLLGDPDLGTEAAALADLRVIGEGFLKLSEVEIAAAARADAEAAEKAKVDAAAEAARRSAMPAAERIYNESDKDVTPPVDIDRRMPEWKPPTPTAALSGYSGVLRLVIDETGKVESATLVQRVLDAYDPLLLAAAKLWTFRPARKDGKPVKYQKLIGITLLPR